MIGLRIKEERTRLGFNQPDFAALANASKRTLIDWEKDVSSPTAVQMSAFVQVGVDVQYIITGQRSANALQTDEALILEKYRQASPDIKNKMLMLLLGGEIPVAISNKATDGGVNNPINSGSGTQLNGKNNSIDNTVSSSKDVNGGVSIKAKGKRSQAAFNIKNE